MKANALIKNLIESIKAEEESKYPATAEEYATLINSKRSPGNPFKLVEDPEHWDAYGIKTGYQLAHYLAVEDYRYLYKVVNGFKPAGRMEHMTPEEIEALNKELINKAELAAKASPIDPDLDDTMDNLDFVPQDDDEDDDEADRWDDQDYLEDKYR